MEPNRLIIHIRKRRIIIHSPRRHQRGNRKDIRERPDGSSEEGDSGAAEPPVAGLVVGVGAHVDAPLWFLVGGDGEAAALGRGGRGVFGGLGIAAAAGRGDGVGGGHGCIGLCSSSYMYIVALGCVPWVWHVEANKHFGRAQVVRRVAEGDS